MDPLSDVRRKARQGKYAMRHVRSAVAEARAWGCQNTVMERMARSSRLRRARTRGANLKESSRQSAAMRRGVTEGRGSAQEDAHR